MLRAMSQKRNAIVFDAHDHIYYPVYDEGEYKNVNIIVLCQQLLYLEAA